LTDPITPLTAEQTAQQEASAAKDGIIHRDLVAVDIAANVIVLRGREDETISSRAARADVEGKRWGRWMSRFLDFFQSDHGAKAIAGDEERAQAIAQTEADSGAIKP
jgi:hypothetical protein